MVGARRGATKLYVGPYHTLWGALKDLDDHLGGSPLGVVGARRGPTKLYVGPYHTLWGA